MRFSEVVTQTLAWLQREGRVSYRALRLEFDLNDHVLDALTEELIEIKELAVDKDGKMLVWTGTPTEKPARSEERTKAEAPEPRIDLDAEAERRQLTVMFCDLVGSTALSAQLDPEELRDVVRAYHETCASAIRRYGGHTAQHLGDGLLVYFGYPTAHEDDAQRAVRTGFDILLGLQQLNDRLPPTIRARLPHSLQVRIGIHTGLVVVGEIGSGEKHETLALGETPNIAARIQGQAEADTMLVSAATYHLIEGLFECEDHGQPALKGVALPLRLYRVLKAEAAQSRFQVVVRKGLTPLVGREREYALLHERWQQVKGGGGQVVLLNGEPGIGKSRLVEALKQTVEQEGARCLELRCSPYAQNSALAPMIEHLQRQIQFGSTDAPKSNLEKLQQALSRHSLPQADALPLLAALLSLPPPDDVPPLTLSPQKQKEKTQEVLVAWLCEEARQQAVTYAWEDLHWADPSTLELLALFLQQVPTARLLAVLTHRPEFIAPWSSHAYVSQLTLSRLAQSHVEAMVDKVTGGKTLPREILRQIASKTDGVPLFVEELTKMVLESGLVREVNGHYELSGSLPPLAIPSTLQDSLMARLDRLATAKDVAQLGATLGREFSYELVKAVSPLEEASLRQALAKLVEAEVLYQKGLAPQASYLFKHALIQDTAYQSLLKSKRQQYHQQIAQVLEEQFPNIKEIQPELVAHHYTEASLAEQAIPYWQRASERSVQRSANVEAISHLTRGLDLLNALPDSPNKPEQELAFQLALATALTATKGYAAPEVKQVYDRARELCQQIGATPQIARVLWGLARFYYARAELLTARNLNEQLLLSAQAQNDESLLLEAHFGVGTTSYNLGEFTSSLQHLEQGIHLYARQKHRGYAMMYGQDTGVVCLAYTSFVLSVLGYPDQALTRCRECLALAQELAHPYSSAYALTCSAFLHQRRGEPQMTQQQAEAAIKLATEHGFPIWQNSGKILQGWSIGIQGNTQEGIVLLQQGIATVRAMGVEVTLPHRLCLLAEVYGKAGLAEEGLAVLTEVPVMMDKSGERYYEAEVYRLKGELLLAQESREHGLGSEKQNVGGPEPQSKIVFPYDEAEACFHKAIDIARQQQAKSSELRASTSLARLWQQQDKREDARQLLAEIYGWFTEGFDTADLKDAKALLEELS